METITMCNGGVSTGQVPTICFRLSDGGQTFLHSTGIEARPEDVERDQQLRSQLEYHKLAMCKAYTLMQVKRMDMNSRIFELQVQRMMTEDSELFKRKTEVAIDKRLTQYVDEALRDGVIGKGRYVVLQGKIRKLQRFLTIKGLSSITPREFTTELLLEYRKFIYDEYLYVCQFPELYPSGDGRHAPRQRCKDTTVVHDLKALQAFFRELEDTDEIRHSPFRKISGERRRSIMHVMYDAPFFLKADELQRVMATEVPMELQWAKDIFVLNCAIGCRISDLLSLTMDKVAVSEDGIPFVHYVPQKTSRIMTVNQEVVTPLIRPALEIIRRTRLKLIENKPHYGKQRFNKALRELLKVCGINRTICQYDSKLGDNVYRPLCEVASSKLARKTHVDMLNKVQINYYAAGLHREGSDAVFRYTRLELGDRFALLNAAFGEPNYRVDKDLQVVTNTKNAGSD